MLAPHNFTHKGVINPVLAIQTTGLSRKGGGHGGLVLAAKAAHPMADITTLAQFVKHWATITQSAFSTPRSPVPISAEPIFDPSLLDSLTAGDTNAGKPNPPIIKQTKNHPLHRYDTWIPDEDYPSDWPSHVPPAFKSQLAHDQLKPTGNPMPWSEWDVTAPASTAIIHFTREQVNLLYHQQSTTHHPPHPPPTPKISKHDALLSHLWTHITSARNLPLTDDHTSIHCNLVLNLRPALNLPQPSKAPPS